MLKAIVFDFDGTLIDSKNSVLKAYRYSCQSRGLPPITEQDLNSFGGHNLLMTYQHFFPGQDAEQLASLHRQYQVDHPEEYLPFSFTKSTLEKLKQSGHKLSIITSRGKNCFLILALNQLTPYFDYIVTADEVSHDKPDPESMLMTLSRLQVRPEEAVMVGDMQVDIQIGQNTGVSTIGVLTGFSTHEMLTGFGANYIVTGIDKIPELIATMD